MLYNIFSNREITDVQVSLDVLVSRNDASNVFKMRSFKSSGKHF